MVGTGIKDIQGLYRGTILGLGFRVWIGLGRFRAHGPLP